MKNEKLILDACCGSRMFWFDKHNPLTLFVDKRSETLTAKDRGKTRVIEIKPDVIADFTNLPFEDNWMQPMRCCAGVLKTGILKLKNSYESKNKSNRNDCRG